MIVDAVLAVVSIVIMCVAMVTHPSSATCPDGVLGTSWWVNGVREDGRYGCRPRSLRPDRPSRGHEPDEPDDPDADHEVYGWIYCTGGARPIVVNYREVGCQR